MLRSHTISRGHPSSARYYPSSHKKSLNSTDSNQFQSFADPIMITPHDPVTSLL